MRISPTRRRRWNNILILGIIAFIVILNAPMWIKTYLLSENVDPYPHLLRTDHSVSAIYSNSLELEFRDGRWHANADVPLLYLNLLLAGKRSKVRSYLRSNTTLLKIS